ARDVDCAGVIGPQGVANRAAGDVDRAGVEGVHRAGDRTTRIDRQDGVAGDVNVTGDAVAVGRVVGQSNVGGDGGQRPRRGGRAEGEQRRQQGHESAYHRLLLSYRI